jgi:hypothetical protein
MIDQKIDSYCANYLKFSTVCHLYDIFQYLSLHWCLNFSLILNSIVDLISNFSCLNPYLFYSCSFLLHLPTYTSDLLNLTLSILQCALQNVWKATQKILAGFKLISPIVKFKGVLMPIPNDLLISFSSPWQCHVLFFILKFPVTCFSAPLLIK